jgi:hypothetical protein
MKANTHIYEAGYSVLHILKFEVSQNVYTHTMKMHYLLIVIIPSSSSPLINRYEYLISMW